MPGTSEVEVTPTLIEVGPGEYGEEITMRSNIRLVGSGRGQTVVRSPETSTRINCGSWRTIICLENANNVEISNLAFSGSDAFGRPVLHVAIAIESSSNIKVHRNRVFDDLRYGVVGERVGNIVISDNEIPFAGDAIDVSMKNGETFGHYLDNPVISVLNNQFGGGIRIDHSANVQVVGNLFGSVDSGSQFGGRLHIAGNQILGNVSLDASEPSVFSGNNMVGTLVLGAVHTTVTGNTIDTRPVPGLTATIIRAAQATIIGNTLLTPPGSDPIAFESRAGVLMFANQSDGNPAHNMLVSKDAVRLESKEEEISLTAGNSRILIDSGNSSGDDKVIIRAGSSLIEVDKQGDVNIVSGRNLNIDVAGRFSVQANSIEMTSTLATRVSAGSDISLNAAANASVKGSSTTVEGAAQGSFLAPVVNIDGAAQTIIKGGLITLN